MRYKTILALTVMVGALSISELQSKEVDNEVPLQSVCESDWVLQSALPDAIKSYFGSVGANLRTNDMEITNIAESARKEDGITFCYVGIKYRERNRSEQYLINYTVNQSHDKKVVSVSKINYL